VLAEPIRFPFDRSDLSSEARSALDAKIEVLRADAALRIVIEGHADDRGSDEYNMALGMRRAAAARRYLVQHGIDPDRIEITSVGEERPVCREPDESCWQVNRRAEFTIAN
jgi:peptidoglycan-associated lipoprotein